MAILENNVCINHKIYVKQLQILIIDKFGNNTYSLFFINFLGMPFLEPYRFAIWGMELGMLSSVGGQSFTTVIVIRKNSYFTNSIANRVKAF